MEKPASTKTFHGSLALKSRTNIDIDAYFSSYLTIDDPIFELSIFDAHKSFFNQVNNHQIQKLTITSNTRASPMHDNVVTDYADPRNYTDRSFAALTATAASSEANWNKSRTGLFHLLSGAKPVSMSNQSRSTDLKKKIKASLSKPIRLCRRRCPCADKKSVQVKEMKPAMKTHVAPPPPPPPFLSHNPNARGYLNQKRPHLESNLKTPIEESAMSEIAANNSEAHRTPISSNNRVKQKPSKPDAFATKSEILDTVENEEAPVILQPQQAVASEASVSPVTDGFTFPLLNPKSVEEDPPGNSLEVFGPPYIETSCVSQSPKSGIVDDDAASDASSDLFEIVSFPAQATSTQSGTNFDAKPLDTVINSGFLFKSKESMTRTITEKYEPSEGSIDWSMSTDEGFEFDTTGAGNLSLKASESGDGGEAPRETPTTHFVGSPLAMCQTAHISLAFAI
ncbi:protein PHYTOCHROME KINASE SUBSTRATE 4-like [Prosopis cineraria]|uniref:protein PHYTOCHROME KINASE SUBSTRATE 4-like n=1 Tax=Prosopis cineraria TaxID=364024 RepID=UPI00240F1DC8|nr:protein PHYTOCHROME KINASE SUBSTRATE 4-like [Prosopis cineraria]